MARGKSLYTINYNRRHTVPREFLNVYEKIKDLNFVKELGIGHYNEKNNKEKKLEIKGFDDLKKGYVVDLHGEKFRQRIFIKVDENKPNYRKTLEDINF